MTGYAGIDVSKDTLDAQRLDGAREQCANTPDGCRALAAWLSQPTPERIVLEATGGYERLLVATLLAAGLPVVVINPRQVRDFAKATGQLAKTDAIDAGVLAAFARAICPPLRPLPDENAQKLRDLLARRAQLVEMRTMEKNRLQQARLKRVHSDLLKSIEFIDKRIGNLDREIDDDIRSSPAWQEKVDLLASVPGIGPQTARSLVANLPELGDCNRRQTAALAGLAPMNRDSGQYHGERHIVGGRKAVRSAMYMATLSAVRWNVVIRTHYQKLRQLGKPAKVALVACMRKLLAILNALLRKKQPWQPIPAA